MDRLRHKIKDFINKVHKHSIKRRLKRCWKKKKIYYSRRSIW